MSVLKISPTGFSFLQQLLAVGNTRSKLASLAIGRVIGQYAPLPEKTPEFFEAGFGHADPSKIEDFLGAIYAVSPIDHKAALEYSRKFYTLRCEIAHGCCTPSLLGQDGISNLFHIEKYFGKEEIDAMRTNPVLFHSYVCGFENILKDMNISF